ncbi:hypothetical protein [Crateriforma spongiae]|uniref:hypothetical protein n=1 Tax=Crateriforma spongiae TaxID=2724528 RepID=UPI0039AFF651
MNENTKTGIFWGAAAVMMGIGAMLAWPTKTTNELDSVIGQPLFGEFKDPLAAQSLRIVTYDAEQAKLKPFEVRKDGETGLWTIPSRSGYPADAVDQMTDAANALVDLKILDIQTENAEDHDDLGVLEPKLEDLEGGEDGVGRLVTFKDSSQKTLASLIVGFPVKDEEGKIYVRKPGEDPVYVVKLDDSPLTTKFQDWIEEDLLQLSSIEISQVQIKDYTASLNATINGLTVQWDRNFEATASVDGSDWSIDQLLVYDANNPQAEPTPAEIPEDASANKETLDEMKNALDDLRIVDVVRKPEGMSASLKADESLVSNNEARQSLLDRGFFPVGDDIISAYGETTVTLDDGVQYVLRFGDVTGMTEEQEDASEDDEEGSDEEASGTGVNRYLLVTTRVKDDFFPAPELDEVPKDLDDLDALMKQRMEASMPAEPTEAEQPEAEATPQEAETAEAESSPSDESESMEADDESAASEDAEEPSADEESDESTPSEEASTEEASDEAEDAGGDDSQVDAPEQQTVEGEAEGQGSGGGMQADDESTAEDAGEAPEEDASEEEPEGDQETASQEDAASSDEASDDTSEEAPETSDEGDDQISYEDMTEEEKLELLEAEQEKITKANQRKLDERKEKVDAAARRVRELNERFADWYYVIPESTYRELRISRDDLFASETDDAAAPGAPTAPGGMQLPSGPSFGMPPTPQTP